MNANGVNVATQPAPGWYLADIDDIQQEPGWGLRQNRIYFDGHKWQGLLQSEIVVGWHEETSRQDGGE